MVQGPVKWPDMLLFVGPSPGRAGGIATWLRLVLARIEERAPSLPVHHFSTDKGAHGALPARVARGLATASRLDGRLRALRPDLVHVTCGSGWGLREAGVFAALARARGASVVMHLHAASLFERMDASAFEQTSALLALGRAHRLAVLAPSVIDGLRSRGWTGRAVVVPNGVPIGSRAPAPPHEGPLRLVVLGRPDDPRKGLPDLLAALERLPPATRASIEIRWFGPGAAPVPPPGLRFPGPLAPEEVPGALADAHALLLCSRREGLPFVVLEAMAAGRPVLATAVGAVPELLARGGWLVRPGDPADLARGLEEVVARRAKLSAIGEAAREQVAARWTLDHTIDALREVWAPEVVLP